MGSRVAACAAAVLFLLASVPSTAARPSTGIFRKEMSVTTRDGVTLPAVFFRPRVVEGKLPVVALPHGGGDRGECTWYIDKAKAYARRGYVSIIYTARGHGRFPGLIPRPCPNDGRATAHPDDMFDAFGPKTLADLYDVINAVVRDPASHADRKTVGIHGYSQGGATTNLGGAWEDARIRDLKPGSTRVEINPYGIDIDAIGPAHTFYGLRRSLAPNGCTKESFGLALLGGYYGSGAIVDPYFSGRWTAALASGEPAAHREIRDEMKLRSPETYSDELEDLPSFWAQAFDDLLFPVDEAVKAFRDGAIDRLWLSWGGHAAPASNVSEREVAARERTWHLWFDRFLKGRRNGIDKRPRVTYWYHDPAKPKVQHRATSETWPPRAARTNSFFLGPADRLLARASKERGQRALVNAPGMHSLSADPIVAAMPLGSSLPPGARTPAETAVFSTPPLKERTLLAGAPSLDVFWTSTAPEFQTNALLWDVYPDGSRWLVSRGCARHEATPGQKQRVALDLFHSVRLLAPGHRLELWVSPVDHPTFLPSKHPSANVVHFSRSERSRLEIPLLRPPH
ncbi:MAG: CocE/NonD family hydrolase [Actinobacteria bacterium]|nr:CocE/NonD family hydrolase [Actinomycetota bacterium]